MLFLLVGIYLLLQTPIVQNWLGQQIANRFSKELKVPVKIEHVDFSLFNKWHLEGFFIGDQKGDTLLYAGDLSIKTNDWFIFKDKIELNYIGLENAILKTKRTDSIWQHQFIIDYFGVSKSSNSNKKNTEVNLKEVHLQNVRFSQEDYWLGQTTNAKVKELNLVAKHLTFTDQLFDISSMEVDNPVVAIKYFKANQPTKTDSAKSTNNNTETVASKGNSFFKIGSLQIKNGFFSSNNELKKQVLPYFDVAHIELSGINASLQNASADKDSLLSELKISAKERSGLVLKDLSANLKITAQGIDFKNLRIETNRSLIQHSLSLSYNSFSDFTHFLHKVKISATLDSSYISSDDIAYFAPSLRDWKKNIAVKGFIAGTIDNLKGTELNIRAGNKSYLLGDLSIVGLPNIEKAIIDFNAKDLSTTYADAGVIFPAIKTWNEEGFKQLNYLRFKGSFKGSIRNFVTNGIFQTGLGTIKTNLKFKIEEDNTPSYAGALSLEQFNLGSILGDEQLKNISFTGNIKGKGIEKKSLNAKFDGLIHHLEYLNYSYEKIGIHGDCLGPKISASLDINDENLSVTNFNASLNLTETSPEYSLNGHIERALLKPLHLSNKNIFLAGDLNLHLKGDDIENIAGTVAFNNAQLSLDDNVLPFDSLVAKIQTTGEEKKLEINSNELSAKLSGDFHWKELPSGINYFLHKYYPNYFASAEGFSGKQTLHFDVRTLNVEPLLPLFTSQIAGLNNSHLIGDINTIKNELKLTADIPTLQLNNYNLDNIKWSATGNTDSLVLLGNLGSLKINDSLHLPPLTMRIMARNDSSRIGIVSGSNQTVQSINIHTLVKTFKDGVQIDFDPSDFTINGKSWTIDEQGQLVLRKDKPVQAKLSMWEGEQKISLKTSPTINDKIPGQFQVELSNLNLNDFAPYFLPHNRLEGLVSGKIIIDDPVGNLTVSSNDIQTKLLRLDNDSIGELGTAISYNHKTKKLIANGGTLNKENYLGFNAAIDFSDSADVKKNIVNLKAKTYPIKMLEHFIGHLFTDINGYLTGDVNISGNVDDPSVTGKGRITNAGLKVDYTQCYYKLDDKEVELTNKLIDLDGIVLRDTITGNPIYVTGGIQHESFHRMQYNLEFSTRKPNTTDENNNKPVQLLNTTRKDNSIFYGDVKGTASLQLKGPQSELLLKIKASVSDKDSSYITIPPTSGRESGIADFLIERKYGKEMSASRSGGSSDNFIYDAELTANPKLNVKVVMDELTGDEIKGKGSGTLKIRSGTIEPTTFRGRFNIEEGNYLFTFQSFFKKPFEIRKGGDNYLEWTGDPYNANIKFEALYKADRVSFAPLASTLNLTSDVSNARSDVYVVAKLTSKLFKPDINFSLEFPSNSVATSNPELGLMLKQMQKNPNEINRQVTYLIVFNSFAPSQLAGVAGASKVNMNTISGILLSVLSDQINRLFSTLLKSDKYTINLNTSLYNRNLIASNNTALNLGGNVNLSIGRSFFNNRFLISTGLGMDAPFGQNQQASVQQSILLLPDVTMEWLMNPSGTIRASFFYRTNADYLSSGSSAGVARSRRAGTSLSFKKEFNRYSDLFKKKKKN